jgi:excisionase family DNA binding protein
MPNMTKILTMDELAAYLKLSKSTLYKLAVEDKLPGQKIGKRWRFHKDAIDAWVTHGLCDQARKPGSNAL